jgi:hypothetical protein
MIRRGAADRRMSMCNEMECKREETQRRQKGAKGILGGRDEGWKLEINLSKSPEFNPQQ